jgi:hypothetical protein
MKKYHALYQMPTEVSSLMARSLLSFLTRFNFSISFECGGGSYDFFPSVVSGNHYISLCTIILRQLDGIPCSLRSFIIFSIAGLMNAIFATPVINMVARGAKTVHRFGSANVPWIPDGVDPALGYVKARKTGTAVCMPK